MDTACDFLEKQAMAKGTQALYTYICPPVDAVCSRSFVMSAACNVFTCLRRSGGRNTWCSHNATITADGDYWWNRTLWRWVRACSCAVVMDSRAGSQIRPHVFVAGNQPYRPPNAVPWFTSCSTICIYVELPYLQLVYTCSTAYWT